MSSVHPMISNVSLLESQHNDTSSSLEWDPTALGSCNHGNDVADIAALSSAGNEFDRIEWDHTTLSDGCGAAASASSALYGSTDELEWDDDALREGDTVVHTH